MGGRQLAARQRAAAAVAPVDEPAADGVGTDIGITQRHAVGLARVGGGRTAGSDLRRQVGHHRVEAALAAGAGAVGDPHREAGSGRAVGRQPVELTLRREGGAWRCRHQREAQHLAGIHVSGRHGQAQLLGFMERHVGQGADHRRIVERPHGDRDRGQVAAELTIAGAVGEAVAAVEVGVWRVGITAVAPQHQLAVHGRLGQHRCQCAAVAIQVIEPHIEHQRRVLVSDKSIVGRHRRAVDQVHRDRHHHHAAAQCAIAGAVAELVGAQVVGRRRVDHLAGAGDTHAAVRRRRHDHRREHAGIDVAVIGQHIDDHRQVARGAHRVGPGHGRGVAAQHGDVDPRRRAAYLAVADGVEEVVGPAIPCVRLVGQRAVGVDVERAVLGRHHRGHVDRVAIGITVIGQHVKQLRGVARQRHRVVDRHRCDVVGGDEADVVDADLAAERAEAEQVEAQQRRLRGGDGRHVDAHLDRPARRARQHRRDQAVEGDARRGKDLAVTLEIDRRIGVAQADAAQQGLAGVQADQGHFERVADARARAAELHVGQVESEEARAQRNAQLLRQAGIEGEVLGQHGFAVGDGDRAPGGPGRRVVEHAVGDAAGQQAGMPCQLAGSGAVQQVSGHWHAALTHAERGAHHAGCTATAVRQAQGVAVLVGEQGEQVHLPGGGTAQRPVARTAVVVEGEFFVVGRGRIDEPAAAGAVVVDVEGGRLTGLRHTQPEHVTAQLADHQPHVRQGLGVGTHGGPGGARLRGQDGDGRLGRRGSCGEARRDCPRPVRHVGADCHAPGADTAVIVFDGQRHDMRRAEAVRHGQAGAGQHRAVAEVPGPAVRVQRAGVGEAALEGEQAGPTARGLRDADRHRRRDVVDVEANRGVVVGRAGEGRGAELEVHLGVVEVGGEARLVVTVGVRDGLIATRGDRHVQRFGAVGPVDIDGIGSDRRCGGAIHHQRNGGAFGVRGRRHREPLDDDLGDDQHRGAATAHQRVVVGDRVGGCVEAWLVGKEVEDVAASQGRHHAARRSDDPFQCPGIDPAHIGESAQQRDRVELGHHLAGAGIDHGRHVVDVQRGGGVGAATVVVHHRHGDGQRVGGAVGGVVI